MSMLANKHISEFLTQQEIVFALSSLLLSYLCRLMRYEKRQYARIGIMPRYGDADSMRWFEVEPCSVFHIFNCYEDGDDVCLCTST